MARNNVREIASHRTPRSARARRTSLAAAGLAATVVAGGLVVGLSPAAHASSSDNAGFLAHLNGLRAAHGLPALSMASDLSAVAAAHSAAMSSAKTIFHNPSLPNQVSNWQVLGENVGMGGSVSSIDTAFDHSPEHYANEISSAYTQVGIGTAWDSRGYLYVTLDFRKPMHAVSSAPAPVTKTVTPPPVVRRAPSRTTNRGGSATSALTGAASTASSRAVKSATTAPAAPAAPAVTAAARTAQVQAAVRRSVASSASHALPQGADPVAYALAFSRLMATIR